MRSSVQRHEASKAASFDTQSMTAVRDMLGLGRVCDGKRARRKDASAYFNAKG